MHEKVSCCTAFFAFLILFFFFFFGVSPFTCQYTFSSVYTLFFNLRRSVQNFRRQDHLFLFFFNVRCLVLCLSFKLPSSVFSDMYIRLFAHEVAYTALLSLASFIWILFFGFCFCFFFFGQAEYSTLYVDLGNKRIYDQIFSFKIGTLR